MPWEEMTLDEYAAFETAAGSKVVKKNDIWWIETRRFFYRPLHPLRAYSPHSAIPPLGHLLGGAQHIVQSPEMANSCIKFFLHDESHNYSYERLPGNLRYSVRKGRRYFVAKQVSDFKEFITEGYQTYMSFYERTKYFYKKERRNHDYFVKWAESLFGFPKVMILGAYHDGLLSAICISYRVDDIIICASCFARTESLKFRVADFMEHMMRERAASCTAARYIYCGPDTGRTGLAEHKLKWGCKIVSKPAFYRMNPLSLFVTKVALKKYYRKLNIG